MRLFGLDISRAVKGGAAVEKAANLSSVNESRGWFRIYEPFSGAWQRNVTVDRELVLSYHAVYACMTLIASDISKLRVRLVQEDKNGIWEEVDNSPFIPVLRKPNRYQNRIQFYENWVLSKLMRGNTYVLKERDARGVVTAMYILDPQRVTPMVADDGAVYYQLQTDSLAGLMETLTAPASEIIHDRFNCLFHPLVGTSPLYANGVAATQGLRIQSNSANFFGNQSKPGGILAAPAAISTETAERLKTYWNDNFTGENAGKIAVVGDGLQFQQLTVSASDSQLIEQLRWTAEVICSTFHVPPYKIGVGQMPTVNNVQTLNIEYYSQCLQVLIEAIELCLDEGLGLDKPKADSAADGKKKSKTKQLGTEFDLDGLLRMDSSTQMDVLEKSKGKLTVNEQRLRLNVKPVEGGDTVYLQEQDHSLAALAKRDAGPDPFGKGTAKPDTNTEPQASPSKSKAKFAGELVYEKAA